MLDLATPRGRIIAAALRLAAERPWDQVVLRDIAEAAGTDLVALRREFPSKPAILSAFARAVDDAVLARVPKFSAGEGARDRLFDVIMTRFDVLAPYKPALRSISKAGLPDLELIRRMMATQAWMLHAAGIGTDGLTGFSRVSGLSALYAGVLQTWLDDEDPGHARTMAALDRRLKRGEQSMRMLSDTLDGVGRLADRFKSLVTGPCRSAPVKTDNAASSADTSGGAPRGTAV